MLVSVLVAGNGVMGTLTFLVVEGRRNKQDTGPGKK